MKSMLNWGYSRPSQKGEHHSLFAIVVVFISIFHILPTSLIHQKWFIPSCQALPLELNDLNFMVVTDVHSWVAGHLPHEPNLDADYGDILSFYERLKQKCDQQQKDLFFVMNGDFIDGTGLTTYPPNCLTPILEKMPWDAVNIGNHELYRDSTIEYISQPGGFVDHWDGAYLTSNTIFNDTQKPIGSRYIFLNATYTAQPHRILTMGFLYNFQNHCPSTIVEKVEDVVNSTWFTNVVNGTEGSYQSILILAHMDVTDPLLNAILNRIRFIRAEFSGEEENPIPVVFLTGHTHIRGFQILDEASFSLEAGRYLDTVGFVSYSLNHTNLINAKTGNYNNNVTQIPCDNGLTSVSKVDCDTNLSIECSNCTSCDCTNHTKIATMMDSVYYSFIDGQEAALKEALDTDILETTAGNQLSQFIRDTQDQMGLLNVIGCTPNRYYMPYGIDRLHSLWGLYVKEVVPTQLFKSNPTNDVKKLFIQGVGGLRYDLFEGNVTETDLVSVTPYDDDIYLVDSKITGEQFIEAFGLPNIPTDSYHPELPDYAVAGVVSNSLKLYSVYTVDFDLPFVKEQLENVTGRILTPTILDKITTRTIWKTYFLDFMPPCLDVIDPIEEDDDFSIGRQSWQDSFAKFTAAKVIGLIISLLALITLAFILMYKRKNYTEVDEILEEDSSISDGDVSFSNDFESNQYFFNSPLNSPLQSQSQSHERSVEYQEDKII